MPRGLCTPMAYGLLALAYMPANLRLAHMWAVPTLHKPVRHCVAVLRTAYGPSVHTAYGLFHSQVALFHKPPLKRKVSNVCDVTCVLHTPQLCIQLMCLWLTYVSSWPMHKLYSLCGYIRSPKDISAIRPVGTGLRSHDVHMPMAYDEPIPDLRSAYGSYKLVRLASKPF